MLSALTARLDDLAQSTAPAFKHRSFMLRGVSRGSARPPDRSRARASFSVKLGRVPGVRLSELVLRSTWTIIVTEVRQDREAWRCADLA